MIVPNNSGFYLLLTRWSGARNARDLSAMQPAQIWNFDFIPSRICGLKLHEIEPCDILQSGSGAIALVCDHHLLVAECGNKSPAQEQESVSCR